MKVFMTGIYEMADDQDGITPPVAILSPLSSSPALIKTFYTSRKYLLVGYYTLRQKFIGNQTFRLHLHTDWGWYRGERCSFEEIALNFCDLQSVHVD